ncbi:hypothetical protein IWQ57_000546 [Coemansia nantahalensis]|uniref:Uncharacterized protein n=1 Tax=Coemansia nantahalensis TaxID=2789366 RepID=A0ACC1K790_9FUNG|nr:hypothetical protein IWQ57_000546 [Coemansia nantahalensis]
MASCPGFNFNEWAVVPHAPASTGPLQLPSMRPPVGCRTFTSAAVEQALEAASRAISDPDIRQLLVNTLPNTLDTAVAWHSSSGPWPYTFVITGDINAQWTRDSANQLLPLVRYMGRDVALQRLIAGLVNMQAEQIAEYPFANAYKPPPRSGLVPAENSWAAHDRVEPPFDRQRVFEAKFEIDSLAAFFKLSTAYWRAARPGGSGTDPAQVPFVAAAQVPFVDTGTWCRAVGGALDVLEQLQRPTLVDGNSRLTNATVTFLREASRASETSFGGGRGNPVRETGMVRSLFRPSDDAVMLPFFVPGNAMLAVELERLADMAQALGGSGFASVAARALRLARAIRAGISEHAIVDHPRHGRVYAFEVDGYGGRVMMDDANVPSLLALPYLGFVDAGDPVYQNTRRMVLSEDNPWHFAGSRIQGVGSPHTGFLRVWPMAVAVRAITSSDPAEIRAAVQMLAGTTAGLGLMHESVSAADPAVFTRPWFAWCNGVAAELIIDTVSRFPGLL